jgi:tripartite-type tricarboxylate transporter receptor subunit TctC
MGPAYPHFVMSVRRDTEKKLIRRRFLRLATGAAVLAIAPHTAKAESFPARPVHIVVGFPPGGAIGSIALPLIGQSLRQRWGQPVVVDNRPGAGGNVAAALVVAAPPDGYTLIETGVNAAINATLYKNLPFNFIRDIAMVAGIMQTPLVMLTIQHSRPTPPQISSLTRTPIPAKSTWRRAATAQRRIWRASCSR